MVCFFLHYFPLTSLSAEPQPASPPAQLWEFPSQKNVQQTFVVGFQLLGKKRTQRIYVADFDMALSKTEHRLVPLFRLLRLLMATGQRQDTGLVFQIETGPEARLDISANTLQVNGKTIPVEIKTGNSDVTGQGEMYVSESILKEAFGFDYTWSEQNYEYVATTDKNLELFKRLKTQSPSLLSTDVQAVFSPLPETEAPARPGQKKPLLSFIQAQLRGDSQLHRVRNEHHVETTIRPALTLWGNILAGSYRLKLSQNINYPAAKIPGFFSWVDEGVWTSRSENMVTRIGDTNFGLSDLVAPGVNVFGGSVKYISPQKEKDALKDRYLNRRTAGFLSEGTFEGIAQLGATVELWVNNRLIQTKLVEEPVLAKPGFGVYRFESVGLLEKTANEIKIVVKRTDGVVEEFYRQVLGTSALLPAKQWAVLSGAGTRRQKNVVEDNTNTEGVFYGLQLNYGLSSNVTLGLTAAGQNKYALTADDAGVFSKAPTSYHFGQQASIKLLDQLLMRGEAASSTNTKTKTNAEAYKAGLEYCWKSLKLETQWFSYDPNYTNGLTSIYDRRGTLVSANWRFFKSWFMNGMGLHVYNNLDHSLTATRSENIASASLGIPNIIPKTVLRLRTYYTDRDDGTGTSENTITRTHMAELESQVTRSLSLEARYVFGDKADFLAPESLTTGLSIAGIDQYFSYGARYRANYRLSPRNSFSATYWKTDTQKQAEFSHDHKYYNRAGKNIWDSRIDLGKTYTTGKYYSRGYLELKLDEVGYNRLGLKAGSNDNGREYYYGLYLSLNGLFSVSDYRLKRVSRSGIAPDQGGIEGKVYLDVNGNGHWDKGEPNLPHISIKVNNRSYGESDGNGYFFVPRDQRKEFVTVSLDENSLPAIYTPTQGQQKVYWQEGAFSKAALGVCVTNAISGTVKIGTYSGGEKGVPGVRVLLMSEDQKTTVRDSITADDGSFYIGEIKPGDYKLDVDLNYIPPSYQPIELPRKVNIVSSPDPVELKDCNIHLIIRKK
ncbi:MAG: carboxypeptidase-like regulatory domain-containing protein [bacterium]|nr:carboxypeptidase-like regulatory domain-containing protein [bacterium]